MMVRAMPVLMDGLSVVGTAAMLWVGGGIILHGLQELGAPGAHAVHEVAERAGHAAAIGPVLAWLTQASAGAGLGLAVGAAVLGTVAVVRRLRRR
jgi:hypothetical protein